MSVNIAIPDDLYHEAAEIARDRNTSADEVIASAFASHLRTWDRLQQRAARGDRTEFLALLERVPDIEPDQRDHVKP